MSRHLSSAQKGTVYLVGAGPGSIDLLTLRAHGLIQTADCLLHDDLVSEDVLSLARPGALMRNVGKRCGKKTVTQEDINRWMIEFARAGQAVVRLKSGDPLLFGRAAEEIGALAGASIAFEIVPGISTGFAAAALAGVPLTGRVSSSRVLFATRHLAAGAIHGLDGIGPEATLVLYMPGKDYAAIQAELILNGWPPEARCLVASALGGAEQKIVFGELHELSSMTPLPSPGIMLFFAPERALSKEQKRTHWS